MKILIDANVALDVLLERQPFYVLGSQILGLSKGGIGLFISASTITDIYYVSRKNLGSETAASLLRELLANVDVAAVTGNEIRRALTLDWGDFEDAVQYTAGESLAVDYIVTRNTSDFASATTPVVTPDGLLNIIMQGTGSEGPFSCPDPVGTEAS